jgi:hypothetical protein
MIERMDLNCWAVCVFAARDDHLNYDPNDGAEVRRAYSGTQLPCLSSLSWNVGHPLTDHCFADDDYDAEKTTNDLIQEEIALQRLGS